MRCWTARRAASIAGSGIQCPTELPRPFVWCDPMMSNGQPIAKALSRAPALQGRQFACSMFALLLPHRYEAVRSRPAGEQHICLDPCRSRSGTYAPTNPSGGIGYCLRGKYMQNNSKCRNIRFLVSVSRYRRCAAPYGSPLVNSVITHSNYLGR